MDPDRTTIQGGSGKLNRGVTDREPVVHLNRLEPARQVLVLLLMHEGPVSDEGMECEEQHNVSYGQREAAQEGSVLQFLVDVVQATPQRL